nr:MAG TPA: hypothetical protein [Caudoviricetes sp.]
MQFLSERLKIIFETLKFYSLLWLPVRENHFPNNTQEVFLYERTDTKG